MKKEAPNFLKKLEKYMPDPNSKYKTKPAGFLIGLLHGFIIPLTFIYSQFKTKVKLYETSNIERGYNFGFIIGIIVLIKAIIR